VVGSAPLQIMVDKSQVGGALEKALTKVVDGYKEYVALKSNGSLYPAISATKVAQPSAISIWVPAARIQPTYSPSAGLFIGSNNPVTAGASSLLADLSYGMADHKEITASDLINRPVNWSTGLPAAQNQLFIYDAVI
jgi:hypothetical protein